MCTPFMRTRLWQAMLILSLMSSVPLGAASFVYEGQLDDRGVPANGRYDIQLFVYREAELGATVTAPIVFNAVEVVAGRFRLDFDAKVDGGESAWVEVAVRDAGGSAFSAIPGRTKVIQVPAAIGACWSSVGDAGTNPATHFLGTTDAQPLVLRTFNAPSLRIEPSSITFGVPALPITTNTIGGSHANVVSAGVRGATIGGGGVPSGGSDPNLSDEAPNRVAAHYGTVAGGYANEAGTSGASGAFASVGGGQSNAAREAWSTVSGGQLNTASGEWSTVAGGFGNTASAAMSTVGGGNSNCAGGEHSWAGGFYAKVRPAIDPGGFGSCSALTYPGGSGDAGSFVWADTQGGNFVSSGKNQFLVRAGGGVGINGAPSADGFELNVFGSAPFDGFVEFSLIPKPSLNGNTGERVEFGVGKGGAGANDADLRIAHRNDLGAFFEHLGIDGDGSVFVRSNPANLAQGVQLAVGAGSWSTLSDRQLKTDIQSIRPLQVLERLVAMPIQRWRYIGQPGQVQHIGPMAQDFAAAFGVGENDTTIATVDADGVALAAIQGMNQKLEAELARARVENAELRSRLDRLEAVVSKAAAGED